MSRGLSILAVVGAVAIVVAAFFVGRATVTVGTVERDTVVQRELVRDLMPMPAKSEPLRFEVAALPRVLPALVMSLPLVDTVRLTDTVYVEVPISRTEYRTDDYYAVVEGYRARLLQVDVFPEVRTVTERVTKQRRWGLTLGAQVGYGITPKGAQPYAGLGIAFGYNF